MFTKGRSFLFCGNRLTTTLGGRDTGMFHTNEPEWSDGSFFVLRKGVNRVKELGGKEGMSLKRDYLVGRGGMVGEGGYSDDGLQTRSKGCSKRSEPWGW